jgi:hypothetical protein
MSTNTASSSSGNKRKRANPTPQSKTWTFTHNNYCQEDVQRWRDLEKSYLCIGYETCPDTGTPNLQGMIIFRRTYTLGPLKKMMGPKVHWEIAKCRDAMNYCMKESYEIQDNRTPGRPKEASEVADALSSGTTIRDLAYSNRRYTLQHAAKMTLYRSISLNVARDPEREPLVLWFHGPTGSGKTRTIYDLFKGRSIGISGASAKGEISLDGYDFQDVFVLDELRHGSLPYDVLLRLLDRYLYTIRMLYACKEWNSPIIAITIPHSAEEMFSGRGESTDSLGQLLRRITRTV